MPTLTPVQIFICLALVAVVFCVFGFLVFRMQRTRDRLQKEDAAELSALGQPTTPPKDEDIL